MYVVLSRGLGGAAARCWRRPAICRGLVAVPEHSWSAARIEKQGKEELVASVVSRDEQMMTQETIENTPDHIKGLAEDVLKLSVLDLRTLLNNMQERLGVEQMVMSGGGGGGTAPAAAAPEEEAEKESFDLKLTGFDAKAKLKIIKEVRAAVDLGLKEAKELVETENAVLKSGMPRDEAEALAKTITDLGGVVEIV
jgi:large subunit ribosomal protein L7/L12